jgi:SAM-dependent methyltransferase
LSGLVVKAVTALHHRLVFSRRAEVLATHLAAVIPAACRSVIDVGCGDGAIDRLVLGRRPQLSIVGVDVLERPATQIPVRRFDGRVLPFEDRSHDVVMFVDVLHHTDDPSTLLREAARVARHSVVIKDHSSDRRWSGATLRMMDWVGNRGHGVDLPYNYWPTPRWETAWTDLGLVVEERRVTLGLYPVWVRPVIETGLHFIVRLRPLTAAAR